MDIVTIAQVLGSALIGSAGTIFTLKFTKKKISAETDMQYIHNMKEIVDSYQEINDKYKATLKELEERIEATEKKVEELKEIIEQLRKENMEYEIKTKMLNRIIDASYSCPYDTGDCPVKKISRENLMK